MSVHVLINAMYIIQVKVHLESTLKLIIMMSLSIHMMTSQGHMCVQCVTNGLEVKHIWMSTEWETLGKTSINVLSVSRVFHLRAVCICILVFIAVNTSAQNVANVVRVMTWQDTDEVIQDRNRLNVLLVANDLHKLETVLDTAEFTVETNHTNVTYVTRNLDGLNISTITWYSTLERKHINVTCVKGHLVGLDSSTLIWESTQERNHTSVTCVWSHLVNLEF